MLRRLLFSKNSLLTSLGVCTFLVFVPSRAHSSVRYSVEFEGLDDTPTMKTIKALAQLTSLKKRPPASINALRYRAESDVPEIIKVLHAQGYLEATVNIRLQDDNGYYLVVVSINPGPRYTLDQYNILFDSSDIDLLKECPQISLEGLGIKKGQPALAQFLIERELDLLQKLSECGFPLASITRREFIANGETNTVNVELDVQTGPIAHFGSVSVEGLRSVKPELVAKKTKWQQSDIYNNQYVESTQSALIDTGLFSSVLITHGDTLLPDGTLPMKIDLMETKHRSVNVGASYQTNFGPGLTFGWQDRNVGGVGQKLGIQGDIAKSIIDKESTFIVSGLATYQIPDFGAPYQDFFVQAQAMHEKIIAFEDSSYSIGNRLERNFDILFRYSFGAKIEKLFVSKSVDNANYLLFELPVYLRWSTANSLLNPTRGITIEYYMIPTVNTTNPKQYYLFQKLVPSFYIPLTSSHSIVLAHKLTIGSIASPELNAVPVPKRFLGGSDVDLRGYEYLTVSPLRDHHKPIGGRSAIYYSFETRFRVTETIGLVPFFDIGNVELSSFPRFKGEWFKSVGIGGRYFSFLGPIRVDVGFPLDKRKKLDSTYRILVSIGQMF